MENKHWKKNNNNNNEKARGATTELTAGLGRVMAALPSNITKKNGKQWKTIFFSVGNRALCLSSPAFQSPLLALCYADLVTSSFSMY